MPPVKPVAVKLLALPFAFLHTRMGGISGKVFAGIMLGLSFHLLNRVFANLGVLHDWSPIFSAAFPTALFSFSLIGLLWWLERR